jgi:uncharacterized membrane protein
MRCSTDSPSVDQPIQFNLAANLDPGKGALFVQILEMPPEKALKVLSPYGGVVLKTSID